MYHIRRNTPNCNLYHKNNFPCCALDVVNKKILPQFAPP